MYKKLFENCNAPNIDNVLLGYIIQRGREGEGERQTEREGRERERVFYISLGADVHLSRNCPSYVDGNPPTTQGSSE